MIGSGRKDLSANKVLNHLITHLDQPSTANNNHQPWKIISQKLLQQQELAGSHLKVFLHVDIRSFLVVQEEGVWKVTVCEQPAFV